MADSGDFLDDLVSLERRFAQEGWDAGVRDGHLAGLDEGIALGRPKGAQIAGEIGYYVGVAEACLLLTSDGDAKSERIVKTASALLAIARSIPCEDAAYANLFEDLDKLRGKFKQINPFDCRKLRLSVSIV